MTVSIDIKAQTLEETIGFIQNLGEQPFRAKQVRAWFFTKGAVDYNAMTNVSKSLREKLSAATVVTNLTEAARSVSTDGAIKFLYRMSDGATVESVWMPDDERATLCLSTQVGCRLGCAFCLTGAGGLSRNLTTAEIVDQVIQTKQRVPEGKVTNLVFMGMGEPLDNFDNVAQAIRVITDSDTHLVGARRITLSTSGLVPAIIKLAEIKPRVKLAVSLNATTDEVRSALMPINKKYPIATLIDTLKRWPLPTGQRITIEYVLIAGVNDSDDDAHRLHELTRSFASKINLIPFNPCGPLPFDRPSNERVERFREILIGYHRVTLVRQSRGADIMAACGQLREVAGTPPVAS
jgi:23S rRNA (adenine2503-C2)-methyltransferase